ncbi:ABC transporter ATP-binding protein [Ammoniphilus sp. YIM 78166]|uniref:ABC transporter ATP-binding protein n=1 Tax=Ammoniphilus sp. YIM 78166 TaxID=1644106 RepID=UPI00106FAFDC|nr:ABC transporter ATP-binding protein [Ammoniphilus sp. YIM 78166]
MPILEVRDLSISFQQYKSGLRQEKLNVITNLSLEIQAGEILAVVGASGSGKSLLAHAILGILPSNAAVNGSMRFAGEELTLARQEELRGREIALIPQSVNFLDPLMRVGAQVRTAVRQGNATQVQKEVFHRYGLGSDVEKLYPFQLSGGMARRALVSTAVISGSKLIIADEPTPGLDSKVIQEALRSFRELADQGCAVMMITHDIESALQIADKIAVFYAGTTVEVAPVQDFSGRGESLRHPYSRALWRALPQNDFMPIPGSQPLANALPPGCLFAPRCKMAKEECSHSRPPMREVRQGLVRCFYAS